MDQTRKTDPFFRPTTSVRDLDHCATNLSLVRDTLAFDR